MNFSDFIIPYLGSSATTKQNYYTNVLSLAINQWFTYMQLSSINHKMIVDGTITQGNVVIPVKSQSIAFVTGIPITTSMLEIMLVGRENGIFYENLFELIGNKFISSFNTVQGLPIFTNQIIGDLTLTNTFSSYGKDLFDKLSNSDPKDMDFNSVHNDMSYYLNKAISNIPTILYPIKGAICSNGGILNGTATIKFDGGLT